MRAQTSPAELSDSKGFRQQTELVYCTVRSCQTAVTFQVRGRLFRKRVRVVHCPVMHDCLGSCGQHCLIHARR